MVLSLIKNMNNFICESQYLNDVDKVEMPLEEEDKSAFCKFCHNKFRGLRRHGFKCPQCKLYTNKSSHMDNCTNDSVVSDDTEGDCQRSLSTHCSDTALVDIKGFSDQNDFIDRPPDSVPIENPEGKRIGDAEVGVLCQYSIDNFQPMKIIGHGTYSTVLMVEHKINQRIYAMKVLEKEYGAKTEDIDWLLREKNVFITVADCPFFVALHCCFQTASQLFFVMEFVRGGDLLYFMKRKRMLSEDHARFYAAEISLALNFLHTKGIIYRDLKLENVLLDHEGHIKLADYGLCKELKRPGQKCNTLCGTPHYMAPEIINREPYRFGVDWWALGVILYEMMLGKCPFNIKEVLPEDKKLEIIRSNILNNDLRIPKYLSEEAALVLKGFLNKNSIDRLGCHEDKGFSDVKGHLFFKTIDWEMLEQKKVRPYYIPQLDSDLDLTNFPPEFIAEPIYLKPDEHVATDQSKFNGFDYVNPAFM
ncbi:hypothetical protein QTP88_002036 [Uroleucon formosanum]